MHDKTQNKKIELSPYYIAFIDVLGATDFIQSEQSEDYLIKMHNLYEDVLCGIKNIKSTYNDIKPIVKIFSDNIVIAIPKYIGDFHYEADEKIFLLTQIVSYFQMLGYKYSMLTRGSIVVDDFFINDIFVYGKALTQSYKLETNNAIYPRIIINSANVEEFVECGYFRKYIKFDFDGICYLDTFKQYFELLSYNTDEIQFIRKILLDKLEIKDDIKITQKIHWLINMFNNFCNENNLPDYSINLDNYPYSKNATRTIYTGLAKNISKI